MYNNRSGQGHSDVKLYVKASVFMFVKQEGSWPGWSERQMQWENSGGLSVCDFKK